MDDESAVLCQLQDEIPPQRDPPVITEIDGECCVPSNGEEIAEVPLGPQTLRRPARLVRSEEVSAAWVGDRFVGVSDEDRRIGEHVGNHRSGSVIDVAATIGEDYDVGERGLKRGPQLGYAGLVVEDEPVLGIIHEPMVHTTYYAVKGQGAFRVTKGQAPERIRVSTRSTVDEACAVVTRSHGSERLESALAHLGVARRPCGSGGLKAARIAEGSADLWISPGPAGMRWDVAPCDVILAEAGGMLTDGLGRRFDYRRGLKNDAGILASNGLLHDRALAALAHAEAS